MDDRGGTHNDWPNDWNEQTPALRQEMKELNGLADKFSKTMTSAFQKAVLSGKSFSSVLKGLLQDLAKLALQAALQPLQKSLSEGIGSVLTGLAGGLATTLQGSLGAQTVTPFAKGGVLAAPAYFPLQNGLGLAGERGAEAIMPLARGPDGRLGVQMASGRQTGQVIVNITTPDGASFRRSEQQISSGIARAVRQGQRRL